MNIFEEFSLHRLVTDKEILDWIKDGIVPKDAVFDSHRFWESKRAKLDELHTELQKKARL